MSYITNINESSFAFLDPTAAVDASHAVSIEEQHGGYKVTIAPQTFFSRAVSFIFGGNRKTADIIKKDLENKYGAKVAQFAFTKDDYAHVSRHGLNVLEGRQIYAIASEQHIAQLEAKAQNALEEAKAYHSQTGGDDELVEGARRAKQGEAEALKGQAEALRKGDKIGASLQEKRAEALEEASSSYLKAASYRSDLPNLAKIHRFDGESEEAKAKALHTKVLGDDKAAALQEKIADALWEAKHAYLFSQSSLLLSSNNLKISELYRQASEAREAQVKFLRNGDELQAELHGEIAIALKEAANNYDDELKSKSLFPQGSKVLGLYHQAGEMWEAQVRSLNEGNRVLANLQGKISEALGRYSGAAFCYGWAQLHSSSNPKISTLYRRAGEMREAQIESLRAGKTDQANKEGKISEALQAAAADYTNASKNKSDFLTILLQRAKAFEAQAEALIAGATDKANEQEKIAADLTIKILNGSFS